MNLEKLNEDELLILKALTESSAFATLKKACNIYMDNLKSELAVEESIPKMRDKQGRIKGVQAVINLPHILTEFIDRVHRTRGDKKRHHEKR